ncbi:MULTISPECIES: hypothetical protein [Enterobacterales]|uniref:hypothetical protein n=1 Tax=Enterobacterales TaxID=91347 RepID=UPI002ED7B25A
MRYKPLFSIMILIGAIMTVTTFASDKYVKIRTLFNIEQAFCDIKTNGVTGFDNRDSAFHGRGGGISSTNSLMLMENGENEISLEMGALGWFSPKVKSLEEKRRFGKDSSCSVDVVSFDKEDNKQLLSSIKVHINSQGEPEASPENVHPIIRSKIIAQQITAGHMDPDYFSEYYYPKNMEIYQFVQKITVSDLPEWAWVKSEEFTGSDIQIQKLKEAYSELAEIINSHDRDKLEEANTIALDAWSKTTGESREDMLFSLYPKEDIEDKKITILPIKWEDYDVIVMNKGRMIRMYNKSKPTYSPLTFRYIDGNGEGHMAYYAPIFSLINGKFVPVI